MDAAKIRLSSKELELVRNADWILTKNSIIEKVIALFGSLQESQQAFIRSHHGAFPAEVINATPKISRGEKYQGLPYVILDYPRHFKQEDVLAIRTLFWWGHYFSVILHVSGRFKDALGKRIVGEAAAFNDHAWFMCVQDDPWNHDLHTVNYTPMSGLHKEEVEKIISEKSFIKLAKRIPLEHWDEELLLEPFQQLTAVLNNK